MSSNNLFLTPQLFFMTGVKEYTLEDNSFDNLNPSTAFVFDEYGIYRVLKNDVCLTFSVGFHRID